MDLSLLEDQPSVTALICTYNGHSRIQKAVQSALNQTYANVDVIVIDDGSVPSLQPEITIFSSDRIRFYRLGTNRGLHAARAYGVQQTKSEFIALLDDDDYWLPGKIEKQMALMKAHPQTSMVCCGAQDIYPDGKKMLRMPISKTITYQQELIYEWTIASSILFRRSAYDKAGGFDSELKRCGDWDCWIRMAREQPIRALFEPLVVTVMRDNSLQRSMDVEIYAIDRFKVLEKHRDELIKEGLWYEALSHHFHSIGVRYLKMHRFIEARTYLLKSLRIKVRLDTFILYCLAWPLMNRLVPDLRILGRFFKLFARSRRA